MEEPDRPEASSRPHRERQLKTQLAHPRIPHRWIEAQTFWPYAEVGHNQDAKKELLKRVEFDSSDSVFETPKPTKLIRRMLTLATTPGDGDIVLDFFAGSGSTGDAVMQANAEDGGNRRFILVQMPEETGYEDYATVADITRARSVSASADLSSTQGVVTCPQGTFGFRYLVLGESNFKVWDATTAPTDSESLEQAVMQFSDNIYGEADEDSVAMEVLLKDGVTLDTPLTRVDVEGTPVIVAAGGDLAICQTLTSTPSIIAGLIGLGVRRVVMLEAAFEDADADKSNAFYRFRDAEITLRTV